MRTRLPNPPLALLPLALLIGCAPSLSTLQPARTVPAGHLQMTTSVEGTTTSGDIRQALDDLENMSTGSRIDSDELLRIARAASAGLVQPPSIGYQVSATYGISQRFEVGLRTSMSAVRLGTRWQFLRAAPGFYGAVGLGISHYLYGLPVGQVVDEVEMTKFNRWDIDVPLHIGYSSRSVHAWIGPKLVLSNYEAGLDVCLDDREGRCRRSARVSLDGTASYLAGQLGFAVGYRRFWVAAELTLARVGTSADLSAQGPGLSESDHIEHDGLVVSPSLGLIVWM